VDLARSTRRRPRRRKRFADASSRISTRERFVVARRSPAARRLAARRIPAARRRPMKTASV